jgi:hypothetical protein
MRRTHALVLLAFLPSTLRAQVRASERGTVSQTVNGATITIDYSRPSARGRDSLFGRVVHWGEVWTPGANWATTIEADRDFRLNDQPVPKGKYAIWMVVRSNGPWTVLLSDDARKFHTQRPDTTKARVRFTVAPEQRAPVDVLTFSFPEVRRDGATLVMQWGATAIPLSIGVGGLWSESSRSGNLSPYVGAYRVAFVQEPGDTGKAFEIAVELFEKDGGLRGRFTPAMPETDPEFDLIRSNENEFKGRYYKDGHVFEQDEETTIVFAMSGNRATGFEMRFENVAYAKAKRVK